MQDEKYFLSMSGICTSSPLFKVKLFEFFDRNIKKAFECSKEDLKDLSEFNGGNITIPKNFLSERDKLNVDNVYENFKALRNKENIGFITVLDEKYPPLLKNIPDYPLLLYYKGDFEGINFNRTVAFVGSRKATSNAKNAVESIISHLRGLDIVIVSGLAEGIDAKSHRASIENEIKTVGVIGSGFKFKYPLTNKDLYEKLEKGAGVIFSEYPYETPPMPYRFPQRNRIVTGMSKGTVVAEAKMKSGAMISAKLTLDNGRELMCIPGLISNPNTEGIYYLLKNGASMVTKAEDVLEALDWEVETISTPTPELDGVQKAIYDEIALGHSNMEILTSKLDININDLMVNLTSMELKGLIKQAGGNYSVLSK